MALIMEENEIQEIEINLLLEGIFQRYGYDFRDYSRASIHRRATDFLETHNYKNFSEVSGKALRDRAFFYKLIQQFSIPVTEMFRDPFVFNSLREAVFPVLRTWPFFKIWHAGSATGEEAYSLAVLLYEAGLYQRSTIYATDINEAALKFAKTGIYPLDKMRKASKNYQQAGGQASLTDYFHAEYEGAIIDKKLRQRVTFANHNLATDAVFGDMQLIFCRNVLIYFNQDLQNRALKLFTDSLDYGGFLCLGTKETLMFSEVKQYYEIVDDKAKIYKKIGPK
jgi:chemotaxis protein methyltransferase CheR